jgi:uncharacterized protein
MLLQLLTFLAIIILLIGGMNFIVYAALVRFFRIRGRRYRLFLFLTQILLSLGFISASIWTRFSAMWLTRIVYISTGVWWGFFFYLFLASMAAWLIHAVARIFRREPDMRAVMSVLLALSLAITAYGIVNARIVRVTRITAPIADLPPAWEGRKAVQLSDVHLGAIYNGGRAEHLRALTDREKPDLIFFTGDYFDGSWPTLDDLGAKLRIFRAPLGTYFINGNHEIYDGREAVIKAVEPTGVTYLRDRFVEVDGVQILGIDWGDREFGTRDLSPLLTTLDQDLPAIALYHEPRYTKELAAAGVDLRLSGHTHQGQVFPGRFITRAIFGPEHAGLNDIGGLLSYTSIGAGTWGPPLRVGTNPEIVVITFVKK